MDMSLLFTLLLAQDSALLDRFDPLDTSALPFVKVATGSWVRYNNDPPLNRYRFGFLLKDEAGKFTVRYVDLQRQTLKATPAGTPEHERVGYEAVDLAAHIPEFVKSMAEDRFYVRPDATVAPRGLALLLARACERRGLRKEVDTLRQAAGENGLDELGQGLARHLTLDMGDPELTREHLVAKHRLWLEAFPKSSHRDYVQKQADLLVRMLAQRRPESEIDGLLFDLREEFAPMEESGVDGWALTPADDRLPKRPRPWEKLQALGHAAVPALIEAVDDEEPTRCVRYHSRYGGSFWVYDVGMFAEGILGRIAGVRFWGKTEERVAQWRAWWKTLSEKGEDAALAEIAATGDSSSEEAAKKLLEKWPGRIGDVLRGVRRATNRHYRQNLVGIVAGVKSADVDAFLREELEKGPYVAARVDAARALLDRGDRRGLETFLREWRDAAHPREKPQPGVPEAVQDFDFAIARGEARQAMAGFLLAAGDVDAVRAVSGGLMKQDASVRLAVFDSLNRSTLEELLKLAKPEAKADLEREYERILGSLLEARERQNGSFSFQHGDKYITLSDPLLADRAACQLQEFWPALYRYDPMGPTRLRERRLIAVKNVFRKRFGQEPLAALAVPDLRSKDPAIPKAIDALDLPRLEAFGLGALPWIEDRLKERPQAELALLARKLSNLVREATLETGAWEAPKDLRDKVAAMKGKALQPGELIDLVVRSLGSLPTETGDVELSADRLGDGTGITLSLRVLPKAGQDGASVDAQISVQAEGRSLEDSSGSGVRHVYSSADRYADTRKAVERALETPSTGTLEIRIELRAR